MSIKNAIVPEGMQYFESGDLLSLSLKTKLESFALEYGKTYDSYLVTDLNREYFWSKEESGVLAFVTRGKYVNVVGGLLGPPLIHKRLLRDFFEFISLNKLTCSFFGILAEDIDMYRNQGFQITKFGDDFRINLDRHSWNGGGFTYLRRQVNFVQRQGCSFKELKKADFTEIGWQKKIRDLEAFEAEQLELKIQAEPTAVFQGGLEGGNLRQRRLFVVTLKNQIEAFVICNPYNNGKCWSVETYRNRSDGVRGGVYYLIQNAIEVFKSEGALEISLCIVPGINCQTPLAGDSKLCRHFMTFWSRHLGFIANIKGIYFFRTRFRPTQISVYLCVFPKITLGSTAAFLKTWGMIRISWRKLLRIALANVLPQFARQPKTVRPTVDLMEEVL